METIDNPQDIVTTDLITDEDKRFIIKLFNDKNFITRLDNLISEIYADGVIDFHDIPNIILFVITLCTEYVKIYSIYNVNYVNILKFICQCFIFTLNKDLCESDVIIIDKLINTSLKLLQFEFKALRGKSFSLRNCCFCMKRTNRTTVSTCIDM
jgi:hypothetical protein